MEKTGNMKINTNRRMVAGGLMTAVLLACMPALGVRPAAWNHTSEADFAQGKTEATVVTSQGELTLGREMTVVVKADDAPAVVSAVVGDGKGVFVAAGDKNIVYRLEKDKLVELARPPGTIVTCLVRSGKDLLAGTGGKGAGVYRIDPAGKVAPERTDPKVLYVWALENGPDGTLYAATGNEGKVFAIDKAGKASVLWEAGELAKNVLCLARAEGGLLYAGTDTEGLVVEIDLARKAGRIVLDATEKEIAALAVRPGGGVYAATADLAKVASDGATPPSTERAGRPATASASKPAKPAPKADAPAAEKKDAPTTQPAGGDASGGRPSAPAGKPAPAKPAGEVGAPAAAPAAAVRLPTTRPAAEPQSATASRSAAPAAPKPVPTRPGMVIVRQGPPAGGAPAPQPQGAQPPAQQAGNAVYLIDKDGLVHTVFRRPVAILSMIRLDGRLIVGTGNAGAVYTIDPDAEEIVQLADTEAKAVTALAAGADGRIILGTSNRGSLAHLGTGVAAKGTFTSTALDAAQIARWGTVQLTAHMEGGAKLTLATRSGNVAKVDDKTWSSWSNEQAVNGDFLAVTSPPGRFLQYRLTFQSAGGKAPIVRQLQVIYQTANLPPEVSGVMVMPSARGADQSLKDIGPKVYRHVMIRAGDGNQDQLAFDIECRRLDQQAWVKIAKKLAEPRYIWDTRTVGDGVYELRITANDSPNNPPGQALEAVRLSEPVVVDNSAPTVGDLAAKLDGNKASLRGTANEAVSRITAIHYSVDGNDEWTAVLPADGICDSQKESFSFQTEDLEKGTHVITVRVTDLYENTGYTTVTVTR